MRLWGLLNTPLRGQPKRRKLMGSLVRIGIFVAAYYLARSISDSFLSGWIASLLATGLVYEVKHRNYYENT